MMNKNKNLESRIRGWFPREPLLKGHPAGPAKPEAKAEVEQKLLKKLIKTIPITDGIISPVFLTLSNFGRLNWDMAVLTIAELAVLLLITNALIFLYLKHKSGGGRV